MFNVIDCITRQHDPRLVLLAVVLCLFACCTTLSVIGRARTSVGRSRVFWIAGGGFVAGSGMWSTHFVAMLAYQPGFPFGFDVTLTVVSIVVAIALCTVGFAIAVIGRAATLGGAVVGLAIGIMHYVGMAALRAPANESWELHTVVASLAVGILLAALGLVLALHARGLRSYFAGALCLTLAICAMHFTGMTAVHFAYDPLVPADANIFNPAAIAIGIAVMAVLILSMGMAMAIGDHRLAHRAALESEVLRANVIKLEAAKAELEQSLAERAVIVTALDKANRVKSDFLAAMSHELRTPLNAIIGFSEMMTTQTFGPLGDHHYADYAQDIHRSGRHLLSLINDVLDLSKLDAGKVELFEEEVAIGGVVSECLRLMKKQAALGGVMLSEDIPCGLPLILADERRIKQVFLNLLANAVKFTHPGGVVSIAARNRPEGMSITVTDTGIGIDPDSILKAFENFGQINSSIARKRQGSGLGLPLAKRLIELHGGTMTLHSVVGHGTVVTALLPANRVLVRLGAVAA
jgi:signal transduction histidine kinase